MIYVYHSLDEVPDAGDMNVTLTLGMFDGVHLGHKKILDQVGQYHQMGVQATGVVTFDRHPKELVDPSNSPRLLTTTAEKVKLLSDYKLTYILVLPFDNELAAMDAKDFVADVLVGRLRVNQMIIGYDSRFGRGGAGDAALLEQMGKAHGFTTKKVDAVKAGSYPVSSTAIRQLLDKGDVKAAASLLGRPYIIEGKVVKGLGLGKKLGFPTANVKPDQRKLIPMNGIYAAWCWTSEGKKLAAVNIGVRPTIPLKDPEVTVEVHIPDFEGDLYEMKVGVEFARFIRPEKKFENVKMLVEQIKKDVDIAKKLLAG